MEQLTLKKKKHIMPFKKGMLIYSIIGFILLIGGVSYAFFNYYGESNEQRIVAGEIYLRLNDDTNQLTINNIFPETKEEARSRNDNFITFTIDGKNTTTNKDIYYEIILNEGDTDASKTRFNPEDMRFDLVEVVNNQEVFLIENGRFDSFEDKRIWVDTINSNMSLNSSITKTYRLRMWLDSDIIISDTNPKADYSTDEFANSYVSVKVTVFGDFTYKSYSAIRVSGKLSESESYYNVTGQYGNVSYTDENVEVTLRANEHVEKIYIANMSNNAVSEYTPNLVNGEHVVVFNYTNSGVYNYYGLLDDGTYTSIGTYYIKIDRTSPSFTMQASGSAIASGYNATYQIENTLSSISDDNDYEIEYAIVKNGENPISYTKLDTSLGNTISVGTKSGIWDLVVRMVDDSGKETIHRTTYVVSYYVDINANNSLGYTIPNNRIQVVQGERYDYIEPLENSEHERFLGYATDNLGKHVVNNDIIVGENVSTLYALWISEDITLINPPTASEFCSNPVYNGEEQSLVQNAGLGINLSNYMQDNVGTYTVMASLKNNFLWMDQSTEPITFDCSVLERDVSYLSDSAIKEYDGTPLTANNATLTSGSLASGHTASFTITGSQTAEGSSENVLSSVTITDANNNDVTSNYNITKSNGTLIVTSSSVVSCSFGPPQRSLIASGGTTTFALTCISNGQFTDSVINASDITLSNSGVVTVGTPVKTAVTGGYRYDVTVTGANAGSTTLTLKSGSVAVTSGNVNSSTVSSSVSVDAVKPSCSFNIASTTIDVNQSTTVTMSCTDTNSIKSPPSLTTNDFSSWSMLQITGVSGPVSITNGVKYTLTVKGLTAGVGKVTIKANRLRDNADNYNEQTSSAYITVENPVVCKYRFICWNYGAQLATSGYIYNSSGEAVSACTGRIYNSLPCTSCTFSENCS